MRFKAALAFAGILPSAVALGQQPADAATASPKAGSSAAAQTQTGTKNEALLEIYQVDLNPSGTAFSLGKPVLEGGAYVFKAWPDKAVVHLDQSKVKAITQRTQDIEQMVVYRIDLVPSGRMIARDNPTLKGTTYTFHTWKHGKLMSVRQADVRAVTKVTGLAAFKIQQEERGAAQIGHLPMEGGSAKVLPASPPPAAAPAPTPMQGNWSYQGAPGVTDAYAPPSAVVSSPGDVPKAAPAPTPPPR